MGDLDRLQQIIAAEQQPPTDKVIQSLLAVSGWKSQFSVIDFLLSKYPTTSIEEELVRAAIYSGSIPLFSTLLSKDPSIINMQFDRRGTPLIVACMSRQSFDFLRFLLEAGADPNQDPDCLSPPLSLVGAFYENTEVVDLLLKHGEKLEHSADALAAAASRGNSTMVRYLLQCGANHTGDQTWHSAANLAVHAAASRGRVEVLKILLEYGVDLTEKNENGETVAEVVERVEKKGTDLSEVKKLLRSHE